MILKIENFVENFLFNEIKIGGIDKNVKIVKMCAMCEILDWVMSLSLVMSWSVQKMSAICVRDPVEESADMFF